MKMLSLLLRYVKNPTIAYINRDQTNENRFRPTFVNIS